MTPLPSAPSRGRAARLHAADPRPGGGRPVPGTARRPSRRRWRGRAVRARLHQRGRVPAGRAPAHRPGDGRQARRRTGARPRRGHRHDHAAGDRTRPGRGGGRLRRRGRDRAVLHPHPPGRSRDPPARHRRRRARPRLRLRPAGLGALQAGRRHAPAPRRRGSCRREGLQRRRRRHARPDARPPRHRNVRLQRADRRRADRGRRLRDGRPRRRPGLGNVDPACYVRLHHHCRAYRWDEARTEQERLLRLFDIVNSRAPTRMGRGSSALGSFKTALHLLGVIDHPTTAPPQIPRTRQKPPTSAPA